MISRNLLLHATFAILSLTSLTRAASSSGQGDVVHEWVYVDFDWPNEEIRLRALQDGSYNLSHNIISAIKIYRGQIYVGVPRLRYTMGVPSTLNTVVQKGNKTVLRPFPNWESQELSNCSALQCAMSMEVDPITGYMYVIDPGRSGLFGNITNQVAPTICPPKLVVFDLNNGRLVRSHDFPPNVVSNETNFLNDIVLDRGDAWSSTVRWVYMTDAADSKLIVFDLETNESRSIHHSSMNPDPGAGSNVSITGKVYRLFKPINGIAMSADFQFVYYCALGSLDLYQVPTRVLRDKREDFAAGVRNVGAKISQTGGMTYGTNNLYFGALTLNAVYRWEVAADEKSQGVTADKVKLKTETEVVRDDGRLQFPDSFTVDEQGYLWFTACRAHLFLFGDIDVTGAQGPNYRIWRVKISEPSYLAARSSSSFLKVWKGVTLSVVIAILIAWR